MSTTLVSININEVDVLRYDGLFTKKLVLKEKSYKTI
jgi:hypothetical protein